MKAESCESEAFRQCFRRFCYEDVSGPREAFSKLWELCCRWLKPEARSKEQMLELLVIEQFLTILPEKIQAWALTRRPESGEEAVALVLRLEKEAGRPKQLCSPVHSKKPDPRGVVWDLAECRPEAHPRVVSREEARSLHSGQQERQNPRREHRPVTKNDNDQKAQPSPWASIPAEEWSSLDQETTTMKLLAGSQAAARGAHAVRGVAHKKSTRQAPPHRDLCRDVGEGSVGNTVALGSAAPTASKMAQEEQRREPWATRPHPANKRSFMKGELVHAAQVPARSAGAAWREQQPWAVDDEKVAGVHWSYEETKTFLAILKESRFYETLQACPRNSQVYGAVAEWLRECGFLRTPEQCRTKFKSLQKSYRKVRNGHGLEPCAFYEDMDALLNPAARAPCAGKPKGHVSLRALRRTGSGTTEQTGLQGADRATDCSDGEEAGIEFIRKSEVHGAPVLFQTLSGVHWGYEETKTFLDILRETRFYDALQACHRKSRLYGAVAERLRACGFLRTPEQCRTKFKSLQKSYRKVKSGHLLESCAFYEDMDALINSWASGPSTSTPGEGLPPSRQDREDIEIEPREPAGWEPEETSQEAIVEDSGSERMSEEELARESEFRGPPGLQQSPSGFETGGRRREAATQAVCEGAEPHRACREPSKRGVSQNTDPAKSHEAECTVGRQGKLASQPRDTGRAVVHQKPFTGRRPYRLLKYGESSGRGARLLCRTGHQKENSYKCNVCGKCFGRGRSLVRHQRIHTGEKPFKCLDCGKSFNDSSNFGAHQRVHTGEKPFGCGQCGKRFSQSSSLVIHQRTHTGEKPYQCGERAKSFTNSSHISARRRVHAGEGPSRCRDCEKGFSSCTRVREHRGTHAGGASCGRQFSKSSILTRHQEGHAREKLQPRPPSPHSSENPHKGRTDDFRKTF